MDGGRVFRALLAMRIGEARATQMAATVGQVLALGLGLMGLGLLGGQPNLIWLFIAIFVFIAAGQEAAQFRSRAYLEGARVRDAMITEFHTLPVGANLGEAQELLIHTTQVDFPVTNGDQVVGLLSRLDLFKGLRNEGPTAYVAGSMQRDFPAVGPDDELQELASDMQSAQRSCTLVMEGERLVGLVTMENLAELLILRQIAQQRA
jgi:CBS domain-containing protein